MKTRSLSGSAAGRSGLASSRPEPDGPASEQPDDPVAEYLGRAGTEAVLTREGEVELARRIEEGQSRVARAVLGTRMAAREIAAMFGRLSREEIQQKEVFRHRGVDTKRDGVARALERLEPVVRLERDLQSVESDLTRCRLGTKRKETLTRRARGLRARLFQRLLALELTRGLVSRLGAKIVTIGERIEQACRQINAAEQVAGMSEKDLRRTLREMRSAPATRRRFERNLGLKLKELIALELDVRSARRRRRSAMKEAGGAEDELLQAVREIRTGERQIERARHELIMANQRLVVTIARKFHREGSQMVDLLQDGNIGLLRAVDGFDHRRGFRFATYAGWWIRQSINRAFFDSGRVIRLPVHVHDKLHQLRKAGRRLFQQLGREPTASELAEATALPETTVQQLFAAKKDPFSLDAPLDSVEDGRLADVIADEAAKAPSSSLLSIELTAHTRSALATLLPREASILRKRYGFVDGSFHTLDDLSNDFGVTRERIRQIEALAFAKLRRNPATNVLKVFLER